MSDGRLGLPASVSIALGGMIGGGIFSVLGLAATIAGARTWLAFTLAGVVAACAGYSYNRLNAVSDAKGGSVTYVQQFSQNTTLAGMVGWTLLFGYIGSMAMYAYAFGSFTVELAGVHSLLGLPTRPLISALAVAGFVGLNLVGARASGTTENVLVGAKIAILLLVGGWGALYGARSGVLDIGATGGVGVSPLVAAAVSFVAFQGWQLLFYDRDSIRDPDHTIPRAVYVAIVVAVFVYILVAVVATSLLTPQQILEYEHVALAKAAEPFMGRAGYALVSVAALVSTGSAINATLFSGAHFAKGMLSEHLLPDRIGDPTANGVPDRTLVLLGIVTIGFTAAGSLNGVTSFASLSFIVVFGAMSALAFTQRHRTAVNPLPPAVGVVGCATFLVLMTYHLAVDEPNVFGAVILTAVAVFVVELTYFERDRLQRVASAVEDGLEERTSNRP